MFHPSLRYNNRQQSGHGFNQPAAVKAIVSKDLLEAINDKPATGADSSTQGRFKEYSPWQQILKALNRAQPMKGWNSGLEPSSHRKSEHNSPSVSSIVLWKKVQEDRLAEKEKLCSQKRVSSGRLKMDANN